MSGAALIERVDGKALRERRNVGNPPGAGPIEAGSQDQCRAATRLFPIKLGSIACNFRQAVCPSGEGWTETCRDEDCQPLRTSDSQGALLWSEVAVRSWSSLFRFDRLPGECLSEQRVQLPQNGTSP